MPTYDLVVPFDGVTARDLDSAKDKVRGILADERSDPWMLHVEAVRRGACGSGAVFFDVEAGGCASIGFNLVDEGLVVDLVDGDGDVVHTEAMTAQEWAEWVLGRRSGSGS